MPTVIEQIQTEAVANGTPLSQLLRRVKLAAVKLKLSGVAAWVDHEIDGYGEADIPDYRVVVGSPVAHNPYNGWIPIQASADLMVALRRQEIRQSIASLEALLQGEGILFFSFPPDLIDLLNQGAAFPMARVGVQVDRSTIVGLLDRVRGKVLDWSLELEQAGVMGEGVSFTQQEVEKASGMTIQIDSFSGTLNNNTASGPNARVNSHSIDNSTNLVQQGDAASLAKALSDGGIATADAEAFASIVASEKPEGPDSPFGAKAKAWIADNVPKALNGVWKAGIGVATTLLTDAAKQYYGLP